MAGRSPERSNFAALARSGKSRPSSQRSCGKEREGCDCPLASERCRTSFVQLSPISSMGNLRRTRRPVSSAQRRARTSCIKLFPRRPARSRRMTHPLVQSSSDDGGGQSGDGGGFILDRILSCPAPADGVMGFDTGGRLRTLLYRMLLSPLRVCSLCVSRAWTRHRTRTHDPTRDAIACVGWRERRRQGRRRATR